MNQNNDNLVYSLSHMASAQRAVCKDGMSAGSAQLKFSILVTMFTIFAVTVGAWFTFNSHARSFETNTLKMDSIYDEMGDVRGENTNVYTELKKTQTELKSLHAEIENLNDRISLLPSGEAASIKIDIEALTEKFKNQSMIVSAVQEDGQVALEYPENLVNLLIVGSNSNLTDTIMVASINPDTEKITLISVPRDLYVNGRRINEIYYYYGVDKLKQALQDILGLSISEYIAVDIKSFPKIVDTLGGVDVYVEKDLTDYSYPTPNKAYQTFSITAGQHHMDGEMAEKYSRSRKSTSDFDRARRQQQVIEALYRKAKALKLTDNKKDAVKMYNTLKDYVHTDLDIFSALAYIKMFKNFEVERDNVLSSSNYLYSMINAAGAYVLLPASGNYDQIKGYVFELVVE